MSLNYYYDQVARVEKDIADLHKKIADEAKRELDKQKQIDSVTRSVTKSTSMSALESKQRQIRGYQSDIIGIQTKKADLQKKIASKTSELARKKQDALKEETKERQKTQKEQENFQRRLQSDLSSQRVSFENLLTQQYSRPRFVQEEVTNVATSVKSYDFFISHATEDKESFVRPLAQALIDAGCRVWYDEHQLTIGDSLRKKIDQGLISSKFGIVVLSTDFFRKNWPEYELNGLVAREMNGIKVILPIWHKVTKDEVLSFSPTLADKLALNTSTYSITDIVTELKKLIE